MAVSSLRLVGTSMGDPYDPRTLSGAAQGLLDALEDRHTMVSRVDHANHGWRRGAAALAGLASTRQRWQRGLHLNRLALELRSRRLQAGLRSVAEPFDLVVQVHGWVRPYRWPYVLYMDTTWPLVGSGWQAWLPPRSRQLDTLLEAERDLVHHARHVFAMAQPTAESLRSDYALAEDGVSVVGGGLTTKLPCIDATRREPLILFVGRDWLRKGGDQLLEAFRAVRAQVPEARLVLAGPRLHSVPHPHLSPGVELLAREVTPGELFELYGRAAVFCMPSRFEPYGFTFLEAMSHGVPCVALDHGATPEVVQDGATGLLVPPEDTSALAGALVSLLRDSERARKLGAEGRRRVETQHSWDHVAERMEPGLRRAAEGRG